jgi:hypothetical protein
MLLLRAIVTLAAIRCRIAVGRTDVIPKTLQQALSRTDVSC